MKFHPSSIHKKSVKKMDEYFIAFQIKWMSPGLPFDHFCNSYFQMKIF